MNGTAAREFLGLHPFFAPKNGWNIKQKFRLFFFLYVHFFLFFYEQKRKKRTKERENNVYQNSLNCIYLQNFLTASLNENFVRKYNESVISYSGRAAHRLRGNSCRVGKALRRAHRNQLLFNRGADLLIRRNT